MSKGIVLVFHENTMVGVVCLPSEGQFVQFHSTSFSSDTNRFPIEGEEVEVVFNDSGVLLAVHGK